MILNVLHQLIFIKDKGSGLAECSNIQLVKTPELVINLRKISDKSTEALLPSTYKAKFLEVLLELFANQLPFRVSVICILHSSFT